jgi:hypothetical protein
MAFIADVPLTLRKLWTLQAVRASAIEHAAIRQQVKLERERFKVERERAIWDHLSKSAPHEVDRVQKELTTIASRFLSNRSLMRDVELVDFIDERMPPGRKRDGIPK